MGVFLVRHKWPGRPYPEVAIAIGEDQEQAIKFALEFPGFAQEVLELPLEQEHAQTLVAAQRLGGDTFLSALQNLLEVVAKQGTAWEPRSIK